MKRVTPDIGMEFQVVEDALRDIFLPDLFQGDTSHIPGREIYGLPVKQNGIALPYPTRTVGENWTASCVVTGHLVVDLRGTAKFRSDDHALLMREGREEIRRRYTEESKIFLEEAWAAASKPYAQQMGRIHQTGAWMLVLPSPVNGAELGA